MANPTTNYGFVLPTPTDLVTDLPADFDVALQGVDTQMLTNANAAIAKTIVDAKGDIIAATAADAVSRLVVGANATVLTADSATATGLKWAAPAAGGGMTLLSTTAITAVASISITSIDQTYNQLVIVLENSATSATVTAIRMTCNTNVGNVYVGVQGSSTASAVQSTGGNGTAYLNLTTETNVTQTANINNITATIIIPRYANTIAAKVMNIASAFKDNGGFMRILMGSGVIHDNNGITSIQLFPAAGNFTAQGNIYIYGVK